MSIFRKFFRLPSAPSTITTGIRSATGLPRAAIAAHYRRAGLFGSDSHLGNAEQIVVQSRLGALPGVPEVPAPAWSASRLKSPRLLLLANHVDALIAGRGTERAGLLQLWGVHPLVLSEIERTVQNVQDIFGPRSLPAKADVVESVMARSPLARAA